MAVFDGHGGQQAAQYCKDNVGDALLRSLDFPENPEEGHARRHFGPGRRVLGKGA